MRSQALLVMTIALLSGLSPVGAQEGAQDQFAVDLNRDSFQVSIDLHFYQNLTGFTLVNQTTWFNVTGTAPTFSGTPSPIEIQNLTGGISEAVEALSDKASVSNLQFELAVSERWVNVTASFVVSGVVTREGDITKADLSWKAFNLTRDLKANNISYNQYSRSYLRPLVSEIINQTRNAPNNFTFVTSTFFLQNQSISGETTLDRVGTTRLLDFSTLSSQLSLWNRKYDLANHQTTWTFDPGPILDLNIRTQVKPGNVTHHFVANYAYNATVTVPGLAQAQGDTIVVESGSGYREMGMLAILVVLFVGSLVVSVAYWSQTRRARRRR